MGLSFLKKPTQTHMYIYMLKRPAQALKGLQSRKEQEEQFKPKLALLHQPMHTKKLKIGNTESSQMFPCTREPKVRKTSLYKTYPQNCCITLFDKMCNNNSM